jgi:hypothetical protein
MPPHGLPILFTRRYVLVPDGKSAFPAGLVQVMLLRLPPPSPTRPRGRTNSMVGGRVVLKLQTLARFLDYVRHVFAAGLRVCRAGLPLQQICPKSFRVDACCRICSVSDVLSCDWCLSYTSTVNCGTTGSDSFKAAGISFRFRRPPTAPNNGY